MISAPIRIAIVEDMAALREELAGLVSADPYMRCVGVATNGSEALDRLPGCRPDVVLMDIGLPDLSGVECVRRLKPLLPDTGFMMLTIIEDHELVFASLQAGATGYLVKGSPWERLQEAIRELHAGGSPMSSSIAREVIRSLIGSEPGPAAPCSPLSAREVEVLRVLADGRRYKEIADDFGISLHTVRTHIHHIYQKLHVQKRSEATEFFRRQVASR